MAHHQRPRRIRLGYVPRDTHPALPRPADRPGQAPTWNGGRCCQRFWNGSASAGEPGRPRASSSMAAFHPRGFEQQTQFAVSNAAPLPWVRFAYSWGHLRLTKSIFLPHGSDEVAIAYRLEGPPQAPITLGVEPFTGMRDFHGMTRAFEPGYPVETIENGAVVYYEGGPRLVLQAERGRGVWELRFEVEPHWVAAVPLPGGGPPRGRTAGRTCSSPAGSRRPGSGPSSSWCGPGRNSRSPSLPPHRLRRPYRSRLTPPGPGRSRSRSGSARRPTRSSSDGGG